jgi:hypothetical protein
LIDDENLKIERKNGPLSCSEPGDVEFSDDAEMFVRYDTSPPDWYLEKISGGDELGMVLPILLSSIALLISLAIGFSVYRRLKHDKETEVDTEYTA